MSAATVIITCYNLERYIGAAIESVLRQDFVGKAELIVVDDCSTDASPEIIRSHREVRYVRTPRNCGSLLAMLAGIEQASNDIICLLDGDDLWRADKLRRVIEAFEAGENIALVTHDLAFIDGSGRPVARSSRPSQVLARVPPERWSNQIRQGILGHGDYVWLGSALSFHRSRARVAEFAHWARSLPDPANTYQDWPLAYWIAADTTFELSYVPETLLDYRLHDSNPSGDASTPSKALRNFCRARNTVAAMREIASMRSLPRYFQIRLERRQRFLDYVIDLYLGKKGRAVLGWLRNLRYAQQNRIFWKETARFFAILLFGASRFSRVAANRSILKKLPVS